MSAQKFVLWFNEVDKHDVALVGGKGANLGEMIQASIPIPNGFIITSRAYYHFIEENKLKNRIREKLENLDVENPIKLHAASIAVKNLILRGKINPELAKLVIEYYEKLSAESVERVHHGEPLHKIVSKFKKENILVAVRSSATAEDLPDASFAGQQATLLNIKGDAALLEAVRECWSSLFEERAIYYRVQKKFDHFKVGIAVPVQRMVQSDKSGIMFTIDPINNNKKIIVIDAIYGLGELIVQGSVTPDHYEVEKHNLHLAKKHLAIQDKKMVKAAHENKIVKLSSREGGKQKLKDTEIKQLAELGRRVERHYYFPQDLEWAIEGTDVFIVQSRPITTIETV
jgi:pyruvate,water dikinase